MYKTNAPVDVTIRQDVVSVDRFHIHSLRFTNDQRDGTGMRGELTFHFGEYNATTQAVDWKGEKTVALTDASLVSAIATLMTQLAPTLYETFGRDTFGLVPAGAVAE